MENLELWYRVNRGKFADGIPPVSFKSNGDDLTNWTIYGYTSPIGAVGDKTDNLFYKTSEMDISTNWVGGKYYPDRPNSICYFIFFSLPAEVKTILTSSGNISAKVFRKGSYLNGMVFAITPEIIGSVSTEYRVLQNDGTTLDFTKNMSDWDDIYLSLGYGQGVIVPASGIDKRAQIIEAFFNNFDLSIISGITMPEAYEPYGYKIPITCGGLTTNIYLDSPLGTGQTVTSSSTGIAIPTVAGQNTFSVNTTVQPQKVTVSTAKGMTDSLMKYFDYKYGVLKMAGVQTGVFEISGTSPLSFTANGEPLRDWVIYGADGGVGDRTDNVMPSASEKTITSHGITVTCDGKGKYYVSGTNDSSNTVNFFFDLKESFTIPVAVSSGDRGTLSLWNSTPSQNFIMFYNGNTVIDWSQLWRFNPVNRQGNVYPRIGGKICNRISINIVAGYSGSFVLSPEFTNNGEYPSIFEPYGYKIPVACNNETSILYLNEPLESGDSISFSDTGVEIPTIEGRNTLTVDTEIQPSEIKIKFKQ